MEDKRIHTDGRRNQVCPEAYSYATRENALKKLNKVLGDNIGSVRYIIIAQTDGRFSPAILASSNLPFVTQYAHEGICVIG